MKSSEHIATHVHVPKIIIIEGVDNVGKSSLVSKIIDQHGYFTKVKFDKPQRCEYYKGDLQRYQRDSFFNTFEMIKDAVRPGSQPFSPRFIFDRCHLGELVYSPLYRGYSGDYVFDQERQALGNIGVIAASSIRLILLTAYDPSKLPDDGKSFDTTKISMEQSMFLDGFKRSCIRNKVVVNVQTPDGEFRSLDDIYKDALFGDVTK